MTFVAFSVFVLQTLQHRQGKTSGFTGACLSSGQYVFAFEDEGYGLLLDRGSFIVTLFFDRAQKFGREAEIFK
jgi:hypothetical protein